MTGTFINIDGNGTGGGGGGGDDTNAIHKDGSRVWTADQSVGGHKLTNVADPASAQDAATKNYVDTNSTSGAIKKDGSVAFTADQSMGSHKLTSVTDPASAQDAATKNYVDTIIIRKDGTVAFTGDQSLGTHKLTNVVDPASAQDAATKNYVDTANGPSFAGSFTSSSTTTSTPQSIALTDDTYYQFVFSVVARDTGTAFAIWIDSQTWYRASGGAPTQLGGSMGPAPVNTIATGAITGTWVTFVPSSNNMTLNIVTSATNHTKFDWQIWFNSRPMTAAV